jgi:starch synthase
LGISQDKDIPLFGMVSRMDRQKGVDLVLKAMKGLKVQEWQLVILGTGDPTLERQAIELEKQLPEKVRILTRFDEAMARRIYGGADSCRAVQVSPAALLK